MPALKKVPAGKKRYKVENDKQAKTLFSRTFSELFWEKVASKLLKELKIKEGDIDRVLQYASEDGGHSFVNVFFKHKEIISPAEIKVFQREAKKLLKKNGYAGVMEGKFKKIANMFGKSRRAVEVPLIWKSKTRPGCYCLFFERFA